MSNREVQDREEFTPFLIPANLYHNIGGPGFELPGIVGRFGCPLGYCRCPEIPPPPQILFWESGTSPIWAPTLIKLGAPGSEKYIFSVLQLHS